MCTKEAEYGHAVHCEAKNSGPLRRNGAYSGDVGCEKVVVEVCNGPSGSVGSDGGIRRGGEGRIDGGRSGGSSGKLNHKIN